jgi:diphosphomevalonate decarboxylase
MHTNGQLQQDGHITWESPSNIALVKYWGRDKYRVPASPSVSMTLSESFTEMKVSFSPAEPGRGELENFLFEGKRHAAFARRLKSYLNDLVSLYPFLPDINLSVESSNSFPHSSGIASSASAISALALCLTSIERMLSGSPSSDEGFFRKASYAARLGSGSASRSVYPGYVLWGRHEEVPYSENEFAITLNDRINKVFREMKDSILIIDDLPKKVSSSTGHSLMNTHPWAAVRYEQAKRDAGRLLRVLESGDLDEFIKIVEMETYILHALMMTSDPAYLLMKPGSLAVIDSICAFRKDTGIPVSFTLDAGPNVHLIYPAAYSEKVRELISTELVRHCSKSRWIDDAVGAGPRLVFAG